jgi:hypothetical protein
MKLKNGSTEISSVVFIPEDHDVKNVSYPRQNDLYLTKNGVRRWTEPEPSEIPLVILKRKPWKAQEGKSYWKVLILPPGNIFVEEMVDNKTYENVQDFLVCNYFRTKSEALAVVRHIKYYLKRVQETGFASFVEE